MRHQQRLIYGVLAMGGSLLAHAIVYGTFAAAPSASGHENTDGIFALAIFGILALFALAVGQAAVRRGSSVRISRAVLALVQVILFGGQEFTEGLLAGNQVLTVLTAPTFVVGLLIQPLVAWLLVSALRQSTRLGEGLADASPASPLPYNMVVLPVSIGHATKRGIVCGVLGSRAPPV